MIYFSKIKWWKTERSPVALGILHFGSLKKLAIACGVAPSNIRMWHYRGVPPAHWDTLISAGVCTRQQLQRQRHSVVPGEAEYQARYYRMRKND